MLAITAAAALIFAWHQVREMRQGNVGAETQAYAAVLLELDRRFESPDMVETRKAFVELWENTERDIAADHPRLDDAARRKKIQLQCAEVLKTIREKDLDRYLVLLRFVGFFETVGVMIKHGFVPVKIIADLYSGPIERMETPYGAHVVA